jgi:hypothetical protein
MEGGNEEENQDEADEEIMVKYDKLTSNQWFTKWYVTLSWIHYRTLHEQNRFYLISTDPNQSKPIKTDLKFGLVGWEMREPIKFGSIYFESWWSSGPPKKIKIKKLNINTCYNIISF